MGPYARAVVRCAKLDDVAYQDGTLAGFGAYWNMYMKWPIPLQERQCEVARVDAAVKGGQVWPSKTILEFLFGAYPPIDGTSALLTALTQAACSAWEDSAGVRCAKGSRGRSQPNALEAV